MIHLGGVTCEPARGVLLEPLLAPGSTPQRRSARDSFRGCHVATATRPQLPRATATQPRSPSIERASAAVRAARSAARSAFPVSRSVRATGRCDVRVDGHGRPRGGSGNGARDAPREVRRQGVEAPDARKHRASRADRRDAGAVAASAAILPGPLRMTQRPVVRGLGVASAREDDAAERSDQDVVRSAGRGDDRSPQLVSAVRLCCDVDVAVQIQKAPERAALWWITIAPPSALTSQSAWISSTPRGGSVGGRR